MKILSSITDNKDITNKEYVDSNIPTNISSLTNDLGYITGISSSDVTTALGYTPEEEITVLNGTDLTNINSTSDTTFIKLKGLIDNNKPFCVYSEDYVISSSTTTNWYGTAFDTYKRSDGNTTTYSFCYYNHDTSGGAVFEYRFEVSGTSVTTTIIGHPKQDELVSGTNIKTINNTSILGSGDISISGGSATDVQINGTSITSNNEANIITESVYDEVTNKIATMGDIAKSSNYIIVSPNAEQTLGNTNVNICGLNTVVSYYGTLLSLNTTQKGIVVGNGVNHIEVSASHYITAVGTAGLKNVYIYKNNDAVSRAIMYVTNNYCILGIPPTIIPVTSGDLITMRIQSQNGTTTKFASSTDGMAVRLVARVID